MYEWYVSLAELLGALFFGINYIPESYVRIFNSNTVPSLVEEVNVSTKGLFWGPYTLWVSSLALGPPTILGFYFIRRNISIFLHIHHFLEK